MQRLIGASIVGLAVIALTPEGWQIGLFSQWGNWALITIGGFFLAWFFLFFKIYQERARTGYFFNTTDEISSTETGGQTFWKHITAFFKNFELDQRQRFKKDVFGISIEVLLIHALLTIIIAFLVSGFLFHVFHGILAASDHTARTVGWGTVRSIEFGDDPKAVAVEFVSRHFSFGFSPKLILLWSSVGLLLGAFVQLIWDDTVLASV